MSNRRLPTVLVGVLVLSALSIGPVTAKRPMPPPADATEERPLTPGEQAEADAKAVTAEEWVAEQLQRDADVVSLACVSPYGASTSEPRSADTTTAAVINGCQQPAYTLSVEARDQTRGHYCGPAVGQVIANWSWAMGAGKNKYSQATIAGWMGTDINGGTNAFSLESGLERGTAGSPRRPGNWNWVVANLWDSDRDGLVADQLHSYVQSNVSGSRMPLAIPVKPHARNSHYYLSSWPRVVDSVGHWIAAYGWYAYWSNTDVPHIAYTDSSRDEGGSTGKFWDPTRHISAMIMEHTRRIVW